MSEKLPFEENMDQQFNQLPIPDEEQSWQKMKALLDEEDKRRRPVAFWFNGRVWGILLLALATGAYFIFFNNDTIESKRSQSQQQQTSIDPAIDQQKSIVPETNEDTHSYNPLPGRQTIQETIVNDPAIHENNLIPVRKTSKNKTVRTNQTIKNPNKNNEQQPPNNGSGLPNELTPDENSKARSLKVGEQTNPVQKADVNKETVTEAEPDVVKSETNKTSKKDSLSKTKVQPQVDSTQDTWKEKKHFFSAGIGIQQQIPLGGQGSVPYDVYGREASISDYIPSVFLRYHPDENWFVMGEFRYGAPQKVNDFNYSQKSSYDTSSMTLTTTTMRLKKTYYHQLPISFNYYVKPGLSVGLGAMYSRFYGAVSEREERTENVFTQNVSYSKSITNMKGFTDSFLHKTQWHFIINTDYQWKNFLLGLRFTKDLQPYIKYTHPDGMINEEKNYSLQVIFRWQFWKSRE